MADGMYDWRQGSAATDGVTVHIRGGRELMEQLASFDASVERDVRRRIRAASQRVLSDARSLANGIRLTGAFAASLKLRDSRAGVRIMSNDPGAGTIEFANRGAVYQRGRLAGRPVGVPRGGPPRALVASVERNNTAVLRAVQEAVEDGLRKVKGA